MARLDASWTRVDAWKDPEPVAGAKWELVEESDELVILDIGEAEHAAKTEVNIAPGTDVSLTGLETETPMLKVDGTVMKGVWDELFGSEIVLREEHGAEEERISELSPLAPCTDASARASGASSATSRRIAFVPAVEEGGARGATDEPSIEPTHANDPSHGGDAPPGAPTAPSDIA
ncbi:uncharacterized protein MJAP1_004180 [Malassezia japonica]|uniref:Transcription factor TFIIIC triple barrel domain-containing protein n=1 Tax=Malassezia japonica TaxID=223818 RepID=A0AAF0F1Q0_9BASI|nr:uncharacterized protein MJAP1_004180 [Malassezia japonica]WFD41185.1 hypothetical protein MJAP1_004180 [Malassezia japonica]